MKPPVLQTYSQVSAETVAFIRTLIGLEKPKRVLETGADQGDITLAVAKELRQMGDGTILTLEENRRCYDHVSARIKAAGLTNAEIRWRESARFYAPAPYDMAILHSLYPDHEEELYYVMNHLHHNATVILLGYTKHHHLMDNLPLRMQKAGLLAGQFFDVPHGLYVSKFKKPSPQKPARIVLGLSAGRSGTALIASLMQGLDGVVSLHEPEPRYQRYNIRLQHDEHLARRFIQEKKIPWLAHIPCRLYVETSHYICKGFLEAWADHSPVLPDLLAISRRARQIAKSWYSLGVSFHDNKEFTLHHLLHPQDKRPLFLHLPAWEQYNDYQLCYWYALEMEQRKKHYVHMFRQRGASVYEMHLEDVNDEDALRGLVKWLGVEGTDTEIDIMKRRASHAVNHKKKNKDNARLAALSVMNLDALERQVLDNVQEIR